MPADSPLRPQPYGAPWVLTVFQAPLDGTTTPLIGRCAAVLAEASADMAVE
jgi:hypothetical protein